MARTVKQINLFDYDQQQLEKYFLDLGEKKFRATQILKWIHQLRESDFDRMTNLSLSLRKHLKQHAVIQLPKIIKQAVSTDATCKWLIQLADEKCVETVFIPEDDRGTLCVSSQVGCPLNCQFCATAKLGFKRNLTVGEIVAQLWLAIQQLASEDNQRPVSNVVFMGMGEPLLNYENVVKAIAIMLDDNAYGLSKYRVTVSTAGIVPEMQRLSHDSPAALAVSLHAPNDELRNKLLPLNKKYPLRELMQMCRHYFKDRRRKITFEYVMLKDINDSPALARQLVKLLKGIRCKINLIPFNEFPGSKYSCPTRIAIENFRKVLLDAGYNVITRKTRGADIAAACGQLAGSKE